MARAILYGTSVSPGIAIGRVRAIRPDYAAEKRHIFPEECENEIAELQKAQENVRAELEAAAERVPEDIAEQGDIIRAHIQICRDPKLLKNAAKKIRENLICASWAIDSVIEEFCAVFRAMEDPYLRERAQDIKAVGNRYQKCLRGGESPTEDMTAHVIAATDISPADALVLNLRSMLALVTSEGGATSHTAILSRSLHLPAVVGVTGLMHTVEDNEDVIIDAVQGCIYIAPSDDETAFFRKKQQEYNNWERTTRNNSLLPAETPDGVRIRVQANLENADECADALAAGAEGSGLYRTEFAYMCRQEPPTEEELYASYRKAAEQMAPSPVVFRTLDAGADKILHIHGNLREPNPNLGLRGIRFCLRHREIFYTQMRALLRAAVHGNVAIMIPMITSLQEVREVRRLISDAARDLASAGIPHNAELPLGLMIETPAAVITADTLARECDFFSIGTNDLLCYTLSIDRNNKHVAYLHDPMHPAMVHSLKRIIDCAHREGISVSVCGELSADPYGLALMLGMGVDSVSASVTSVPIIKHVIRKLDARMCSDMAHSVLMSTDAAASGRMVHETLAHCLGDELAFHNTMING